MVHASGALGREALAPAAEGGALTGAFHPLAAFAQIGAELPDGIAFAIEASEPLRTKLTHLALRLGGRPLVLEADDKALYHAAAVIASNYSVTLAATAARLLRRIGASEDDSLRVLLPLMRSTLDNLERQGLPEALTGPIVRGDTGTVRRHLWSSTPPMGKPACCTAAWRSVPCRSPRYVALPIHPLACSTICCACRARCWMNDER